MRYTHTLFVVVYVLDLIVIGLKVSTTVKSFQILNSRRKINLVDEETVKHEENGILLYLAK